MAQDYDHKQKGADQDLSNIKPTDIIDLDFLQRFQDDFAIGVGLATQALIFHK